MIHLFDGNNVARRYFEMDLTGQPYRSLTSETDFLQGTVIWVWDGKGALKARRGIYPEYKAKRTSPVEDIFASFELLKALLQFTKALQIEVPGYEADDVIAKLAQRYNHMGVHIHSNDGDFLQLENVQVDREEYKGVEPSRIRLFKALVGDPSDNIPGIKGFGKGAWESANVDEIHDWILEGMPDREFAEDFNVKPAVANWLADPTNREQLKKYWQIVGFLDVPDQLIDDNLKVGKPNPANIDRILSEYML